MVHFAGDFEGSIRSYGFVKNKKGEDQIAIQFAMNVEGKERLLTYYGSLDKTRKFKDGKTPFDFTAGNLLTLGLCTDDLSIVAHGIESGALDTSKTYRLTVTTETLSDGKKFTKIKYINNQFLGPKFAEPETDLRSFKGDLAALREKKGLPAATGKPNTQNEDIPF